MRPVQEAVSPLSVVEAGRAGGYVRALFDRTARDYDRINGVMSLGSGQWYRRRMLQAAGLGPGQRVLDVATGTGLTAREAIPLVGREGRVVGLDPSFGMLAEAQRDLEGVSLVRGTAEALPFADQSFDFLSMGYALRHVSDLVLTFGEFRRVLRPGGRMLVLELGLPDREPARGLARLYLGRLLPALAQLVTGRRAASELMRYYWATIEACVPPGQILHALERAGLQEARLTQELGSMRAYTAVRG